MVVSSGGFPCLVAATITGTFGAAMRVKERPPDHRHGVDDGHRGCRSAAGGGCGTGSLSASKSFSERREALFHPRDFTLLGNCQAIVLAYDGKRAPDARRCYLKPDFLPRDRPYWRAREAGER